MPVTVEEIEILVKANIKDALAGMTQLRSALKKVLSAQLPNIQAQLAPAKQAFQGITGTASKSTEQVRRMAEAAGKAGQSVYKTFDRARLSFEDTRIALGRLDEQMQSIARRKQADLSEFFKNPQDLDNAVTKALEADKTYQKLGERYDSLSVKLEQYKNRMNDAKNSLAQLLQKSSATVAPSAEGPTASPRTTGFAAQYRAALDKVRSALASVGLYGRENFQQAEDATKSATNATKQYEKSVKSASKSGTSGFSKMSSMLGRMLLFSVAYRAFGAALEAVKTGINNLAQLSPNVNKTLSGYASSILYLKNSIAAALIPVLQALEPILTNMIDWLANMLNQLAIFLAQLFGQEYVTIATKTWVDYAKSIDKVGDSAKKAKKQIQGMLADFDEIKVIQTNDNENSGSGNDNSGLGGATTKKVPVGDLTPKKTNNKVIDWLKRVNKNTKSFGDGLKALNPQLASAAVGAYALANALGKLKLGGSPVPELAPQKAPAIDTGEYEKSKEKYQQPVPAPVIAAAFAPAIVLADYLASKANYIAPILAPAFTAAVAPAIILVEFLASKEKHQQPISAPAFVPVLAPAIVLHSFFESKAEYIKTVLAPTIIAAAAPAIILTKYLKSKAEYLKKVAAPAIAVAIAPAIALKNYVDSRDKYQSPVSAPEIQRSMAPAIDLQSLFFPSIEAAKVAILTFSLVTQANMNAWGTNISTNVGLVWEAVKTSTSQKLQEVKTGFNAFLTSTSANAVLWGTNIMTNFQKTANYLPVAIAGGLNAAGKDFADWANANSKGFVTWGENVISVAGNAMEKFYKNFVSGLSAAWNQFTDFMSAIGKKISNWWSANKSWAAPAGAALAVAGVTAAIIATGGAAAPAAVALAPIGLKNGGVLKQSTLFNGGEYAGASQNPEIVTPQNVMRDTVTDANGPLVVEVLNAMSEMTDRLETAISRINMALDVDGEQLDRHMRPIRQAEDQRIGKPLFEV